MNRRTFALFALVLAAAYVFWRLRQGPDRHDPGLPAEEPRHWPGLDEPILHYATPEERRRYDYDS